MKKILTFLAVCFCVAAAAAELRIAVVDLDRIFREYYKSRIAEDFLNQQAEAARIYMGQLNTRLEAARADARKSQIGSGDRSEKIRTYNYPQRRRTDHRIGLSLYCLEDVLNGALDSVITPLTEADIAAKLEAAGES